VVLNSNHSYFLLTDDGTADRFGCEIGLRKHFEKHISQQKISTRKFYIRGSRGYGRGGGADGGGSPTKLYWYQAIDE